MASLWIESGKYQEKIEKLQKNIKVEVCVIGAGLTGLTTAYYLAKEGKQVVIVEKDGICERTSGNTTGKLTSQHGIFYQYLVQSNGKEYARAYLEENEEAIQRVKEIIEKEHISCDLEEESAYVYTQKKEEVSSIKGEAEIVQGLGKEAKFVTQTELPIEIEGAVEFTNQAQFNAYQYAMGLVKAIKDKNGQIYVNTKVGEVKKEGDKYYVKAGDCIIECDYVVIATKYPILNFPGFHFLKMYQSTSYVIAMEVEEDDKLFSGMYISKEEPIYSFRTAKEGEKRLLIVAGLDHKTGEEASIEDKYKILEEKGKELYPSAKVKYKWSTEDCIPLDKIPYIGAFSNIMPNLFIATGYKKWGMTTSNMAGKIISDKILGIENKASELFCSTRLEPIKNHKEMGNMIKETVKSLIVEKLEFPKEELAEVKKGEGKIIEWEDKKVGAYRDEDNHIYLIKPVCTHLGCQLSWNHTLKTWDCPCHGSRFHYDGTLVYGPALKDLEKYEE